MNARTRPLLAGLLGLLILWQVGPWIVNGVMEPLSSLHRRSQSLEDSLDTKRKKRNLVIKSTRELATNSKRSLPPDPVAAATLYQTWLLEQAAMAKLSKVVVTPGRIDNRPARSGTEPAPYVAIPITIKAEGTMAQVRDFVYDFNKSGLLHKIKSLDLVSKKRTDDPALEVEIQLEALSMPTAPKRGALLAPELKPVAMTRERKEYDSLQSKNLFVRGYNGPPAPVKPPTPPMPPPKVAEAPKPDMVDEKEFVYLVGAVAAYLTEKSGTTTRQADATLYNRSTDASILLKEGVKFTSAGIEGVVVSIEEDAVTLRIDNQLYQLRLGQNLKEMQKVAAPTATAPMVPTPPAT